MKTFGSRWKQKQEAGENCIVWNSYDSHPSLIRAVSPVDPGPVYTEFWVPGQNSIPLGFVGFLLGFGFPRVVSFHLP